jgi:thiosulfate/3-mercaptopyruvate sulfurtransferase
MKSPLRLLRSLVPGLLMLALCAALAQPLFADGAPRDPQVPSRQMISPEELNQLLKTEKPLVLQVGPRTLYLQAHIPGAEYVGATSSPEGLGALRARVKSEPKDKMIVIYCGCCPWEHCPNVHPAYKELRNLGYGNVRVLYIASNFGADWVDRGYPVAKGE